VLALQGAVAPATLIAALVLVARFTGPLADVGELLGAVRMAQNDLALITGILAEPAEAEPEGAGALPADGSVEFDDVHLEYRAGEPVLGGVSFSVPAGSMVAVVGPSGVGKSSLMSLLPRFAEPSTGAVRIGGAEVRAQRVDTLRRSIAMVFQDVYLFRGGLEENVRMGRPGATDAEVRRACTQAGLDEVAARLPQGWASEVGEGGTALSGGERQRVSIARALLKDAPVLLVDEGTAALDAHSETIIRDTIASVHGRTTVIAIAHRLTTIASADLIVVLGEGARGSVVAESGTHEELLARSGVYAAAWNERVAAAGWTIAG
jgi:ATP-binding cassette, subfamily B, bacterial IrtB/YbtQ